MRHKFPLLMILLLQAVTANAQGKSDLQKEGLLGKVKTQVIERATVTTRPGGSAKEQRSFSSMHVYDGNGNCVEAIGVNHDGSKFINRILYDSSGREIERHFLNANGTMTARSLSFYDDKGQKIETLVYCPLQTLNHILNFAYDDSGNLIEETLHYPSLSIRNRTVIVRDNRGNETGRNTYSIDGALTRQDFYTYDEKGRQASYIVQNESKVPVIHWTHTYNERGDRKENFVYNREGALYLKETFSYEFDSVGNWVKKRVDIEKFKDGQTGKEVLIIYRKLTYY
jgi:hypothetical protein